MSLESELYKEMRAFKRWAAKYYPECNEEHDNGEWEDGGGRSHFAEMVSAAYKVISDVPSGSASASLIDAMLFAVARDNECENLADELVGHVDWFTLLANASLSSCYINAQWQFAKRVGLVAGCESLVFSFLGSSDEYTSRMALQTLADVYPSRAEEYAELFWNRGLYEVGSYGDEYQKIMALHVLDQIGSDKLGEYVDKALATSYVYLKRNAEALKGGGSYCEE